MIRRRLGMRLALLPLLLAPARGATETGEAFSVESIASPARTVAAAIGDLDGDGRGDLLQVSYEGIPPRDRRLVRVYFQDGEGAIAPVPDLQLPLPPGSAAYDIADVDGGPGRELLVLQPKGVGIVTFEGRTPALRTIAAPGTTLGAGQDERGLDRLQMAMHDFGDEPWIAVPGLGETWFLSPQGDLRARLDVGGRANFFVEPPGPMVSESDIQMFYDAPRLAVGDIDGDGRVDILASSRHELRVFLRREGGEFPPAADRQIALALVPEADHVRGSGAVRSLARDVDGDGLLDLLISQTAGGITDARAKTTYHRNRGDGWDLAKPDNVFGAEQALTGDQLLDVDADGRLELMQIRIPVSVLELIELFVTQSLDAHVSLYRGGANGNFNENPSFQRKLSIGLNFDTSRPRGFLPTLNHDLNADGLLDYLTSTDGSRLEVYVGSAEGLGARPDARQALDSEGVLAAGDLDSNGLVDFVLYNPRRPGTPLRLLRNRGVLPGTPPRSELRALP